MLELLRDFVNDNVLYYGTLFGLCIIFCILVCYALWSNYKVKLIEQMKERELEEKRRQILAAQQALEQKEKEMASRMATLEKVEEVPQKEVKVEEPEAKDKLQIETLLSQMQGDLEAEQQEKIGKYEYQQEEDSVISYQELKQRSEQNVQTIDPEEIPLVTTTELLNKRKKIVEPISSVKPVSFKEDIKEKMVKPAVEDKRGYQKSQFISPVYGVVEEKKSYVPNQPEVSRIEPRRPIVEEVPKENTLKQVYQTNTTAKHGIDIGALDEENRHLDEFLQSLKEFRRNL